MKRLLLSAVLLFGLAVPCMAALEVDCPQSVPEGEPFVVRVASSTPLISVKVRFLGKDLRPMVQKTDSGMEAWVLLGIGMHERRSGKSFPLVIEVETPGGTVVEKRTIRRTPKQYQEQHLNVERKYVHLSAAELKRHRGEQKQIRAALGRVSTSRAFHLPLLKPLQGRTSSTFGLRRFFNTVPKKPHSGWDIAAPTGTEVVATDDGLVVLTGNHFFSGNCVYMDHGHGLVSMYMHLSKIDVAEGQAVQRGEVIGLVGATGRVTGPHLHWGVSILGDLVDPSLLVE